MHDAPHDAYGAATCVYAPQGGHNFTLHEKDAALRFADITSCASSPRRRESSTAYSVLRRITDSSYASHCAPRTILHSSTLSPSETKTRARKRERKRSIYAENGTTRHVCAYVSGIERREEEKKKRERERVRERERFARAGRKIFPPSRRAETTAAGPQN